MKSLPPIVEHNIFRDGPKPFDLRDHMMWIEGEWFLVVDPVEALEEAADKGLRWSFVGSYQKVSNWEERVEPRVLRVEEPTRWEIFKHRVWMWFYVRVVRKFKKLDNWEWLLEDPEEDEG